MELFVVVGAAGAAVLGAFFAYRAYHLTGSKFVAFLSIMLSASIVFVLVSYISLVVFLNVVGA
jgi:hypothetical protein